jgi:hypothetical protein
MNRNHIDTGNGTRRVKILAPGKPKTDEIESGFEAERRIFTFPPYH